MGNMDIEQTMTKRTTIVLDDAFYKLLLSTAGRLQIKTGKSIGQGKVVQAMLKLLSQGKITVEQLEKLV